MSKIGLLCLAVLLSGCTILGKLGALSQNNQSLDDMSTIVGSVPEMAWPLTEVSAVLVDVAPPRPHVVATSLVNDGGFFTFRTERTGQFQVLAFHDRNLDGVYSSGEEWAWSGANAIVKTNDERLQNANLHWQSAAPSAQMQKWLKNLPLAQRSNLSAGQVFDLDNARFGPAVADVGVWTSLTFLNEYDLGTYFLQPWQADAVPVLLVHGFGGYPQQFNDWVPRLRAAGYQPWVFHYPSGLNIELSAQALQLNIDALQKKYGFKKIVIVAHSVGGLVVREALNRFAPRIPPVSSLITLSTPWAGNELAERGLKKSPEIIHAWQELAAHSEFIQSLPDIALPPDVHHYLLFSFRGKNRLLNGNSDGSITIESQLSTPFQRGAFQMRGFDVEHVEILHDEQVLAYAMDVLQQECRRALSCQ